MSKWQCKVRSNRNVATFIKELVLELPDGEDVPFRAGGYVQIECPPHACIPEFDVEPEYHDDWDQFNLWRFKSRVDEPSSAPTRWPTTRPRRASCCYVRIASPPELARTCRPATWLLHLQPEARRRGHDLRARRRVLRRETDQRDDLHRRRRRHGAHALPHLRPVLRLHTKRKMTFWYGARSLREAFYIDDFDAIRREQELRVAPRAVGAPARRQLDGPVGFIHHVLLDELPGDHPAPEDFEYYMCGPP